MELAILGMQRGIIPDIDLSEEPLQGKPMFPEGVERKIQWVPAKRDLRWLVLLAPHLLVDSKEIAEKRKKRVPRSEVEDVFKKFEERVKGERILEVPVGYEVAGRQFEVYFVAEGPTQVYKMGVIPV